MYWLIGVLAIHSVVSAVPNPRLSMTITAPAVYQAWLCPQVWCCLIHHEEFSLLDSSENYPLIDCVPHANTHQDGQLVMDLPPVET